MSSSEITVVIVGRPNVGKSTLFNRLFGRRRALVHDEPGVTRDRLSEKATWYVRGKEVPVRLIDTGGLGGERWTAEISRQVDIALSEADVVVAVFDGQIGYSPQDKAVIRGLQKGGPKNARGETIPVIGAVNKVDLDQHESMQMEFFESGLDPLITISAEHGRGIDELKEAIAEQARFDFSAAKGGETVEPEEIEEEAVYEEAVDEIEDEEEPQWERRTPRIAIVGRPNVGKSTLINALTGQERMITSPIAGTTVDAVDSAVEIDGKTFVLVDTAGMRRKNKTEQGVEVLSVVQTRKAIENCDIAILLLDAETGIIDQDEKISGLIEEVGCGVVLMVNKWDTRHGENRLSKEDAAEHIREKMGYLKYAPILFVSAKHSRGFENLGDLFDEILVQRRVKVKTHEFTEWVRKESEVHNPMNARFYLCHQSGRNPPTFVCHVNDPKKVHFSLKRYLLNAIRERWGYMGNPIRLLFIPGKSTRLAKRPPAAR